MLFEMKRRLEKCRQGSQSINLRSVKKAPKGDMIETNGRSSLRSVNSNKLP